MIVYYIICLHIWYTLKPALGVYCRLAYCVNADQIKELFTWFLNITLKNISLGPYVFVSRFALMCFSETQPKYIIYYYEFKHFTYLNSFFNFFISIFRLEKNENPDDRAALVLLKAKLEKRKNQFHELEDVLPHENGFVLECLCECMSVCVCLCLSFTGWVFCLCLCFNLCCELKCG